MYVQHAPAIWKDFPELVAGVLAMDGIMANMDVDSPIARYTAIAATRLTSSTESDFPEIQAWRRAFSRMGLKPTQYRCASEALLRRYRKEGSLPRIHPLIDLCNAVSLAYAIPIAVLDTARIAGGIDIRYAKGDERYQTFSGEFEHPEKREVIFRDATGEAHARRWTNRQSGSSAIRSTTTSALIIAEGMHASAAKDVPQLIATLGSELAAVWGTTPVPAVLSRSSPRFEFSTTGW